MTTIAFSPAGKVRRWAYRIACSTLACVFPFLFLPAPSATAAQSGTPAPSATATQSATPAQPAPPPAQKAPAQPQGAQQQDQSSDQGDNGAPTIRLPVNEVNLIF